MNGYWRANANVSAAFPSPVPGSSDWRFGMQLEYNPAADSDAIIVANMGKLTYSGPGAITGPGHVVGNFGWMVIAQGAPITPLAIAGERKFENLNTAANVTTAVAGEDQITTNAGTIGTAIATDSVVNSNAGTINTLALQRSLVEANAGTIGVLAGHWFPDHSGVAPNAVRYAYLGQDPGAPVQNAGGFSNGSQWVMPPHPGIVIGRYYSAPYNTLTPVAMIAGLLYGTFMWLPERATITKLGIRVTTAVAATNVRLGIYNMAGGVPTTLVAGSDTGNLSSATTGAKEGTINVTLNPGIYCIAVQSDGTPTLNWRATQPNHQSWMLGAAADDEVGGARQHLLTGDGNGGTFGVMPANFGTAAYSATQAEPHTWYRK